jgi:hypothetical protein
MGLEDVLGERIHAGVVLEGLHVVALRHPLDGRREQEDRRAALAEHEPRRVRLAADARELEAELVVDAAADRAEESHVLDFLRGEVGQRVEGRALVDLVVVREAAHLGRDELLDVAEDVRVGRELDLSERAFLGRVEARDAVPARQGGREPAAGRIEALVAEDVFDLPVDAVRGLEAGGVGVGAHDGMVGFRVDRCRTAVCGRFRTIGAKQDRPPSPGSQEHFRTKGGKWPGLVLTSCPRQG